MAWPSVRCTALTFAPADTARLAALCRHANDDLVRNLLRFVGEERLVLCVTRPAAVLKITNLL